MHLEDEATDLTIADCFSPEYTRRGGEVAIYPIQLKSSPLNLHVHGVHVSPKGCMSNKILYVKHADLPLFEQAQEQLGDSVSSMFAEFLRERVAGLTAEEAGSWN